MLQALGMAAKAANPEARQTPTKRARDGTPILAPVDPPSLPDPIAPASSSTTSAPQPVACSPPDHDVCDVWLVRHGERLDEVNEALWRDTCTAKNWHDPPLTTNGQSQAHRRAKSLVDLASERRFDAIYTSPLLRCMQTSEQLAKVLGLPVRAVPGLGECAAAVRQVGLSGESFRSNAELQHYCSSMTFTMGTEMLGFREQLEQLARQKGPNLLVVTHREGMRDVSSLSATPFFNSPYCCVAHYRFHTTSGKWEVLEAPGQRAPRRSPS